MQKLKWISRMYIQIAGAVFIFLSIAVFACAIENGGYPNADIIVSTEWLLTHLNNPKIKIIDRQDVEPGDEFYSKGHIPGSIRMTTDVIKGIRLGIEEMLVVKDLLAFLEQNGISAQDHVVLVSRSDRFPAATRVFWALELLGHKNVSVLDGGIDKWMFEKKPMDTAVPKAEKVNYTVELKRERLITGDELAGYSGIFDKLGIIVVDSRRPDEYTGSKMSRSSDKSGRIPGAVGLFFPTVLIGESFKEFRSAEEIKNAFVAKGITADKNAVFSCVSGCFGTVLYFAARLLDYPKASVYDGGWIEWSRKNYPVDGGADKSDSETPKKAAPPMTAPKVPSQGC